MARGEAPLTEAATVLDAHLASRRWVCGEALSLADLALAAPLVDQHEGHFPTTRFSDLRRWLDRVRSSPAWAAS